ncbi:hypothetical protein NQ176_g10455 [Zarea fungicola]|uniref:Uncharacterized protein n=1 Tax=Zarea fungicola TaxID=93591 RepID=A0ACC1MGM0_9HYPO|nr:hypothetical protein NQ176_g10455 [Lecanicillium fungicola]
MKAATFLAALAAGACATPVSSMVSNEHDLFNEPLFDNKGAHAVQVHERYLAERFKHQNKRDMEEEAQNGVGHEEPAAVKKLNIGDADMSRPMIPFTAVVPQTPGFPTHHERPTKKAMPSIPSFPTHHEKETLMTFAAEPTEAMTNVGAPLAEASPAVTKVNPHQEYQQEYQYQEYQHQEYQHRENYQHCQTVDVYYYQETPFQAETYNIGFDGHQHHGSYQHCQNVDN